MKKKIHCKLFSAILMLLILCATFSGCSKTPAQSSSSETDTGQTSSTSLSSQNVSSSTDTASSSSEDAALTSVSVKNPSSAEAPKTDTQNSTEENIDLNAVETLINRYYDLYMHCTTGESGKILENLGLDRQNATSEEFQTAMLPYVTPEIFAEEFMSVFDIVDGKLIQMRGGGSGYTKTVADLQYLAEEDGLYRFSVEYNFEDTAGITTETDEFLLKKIRGSFVVAGVTHIS